MLMAGTFRDVGAGAGAGGESPDDLNSTTRRQAEKGVSEQARDAGRAGDLARQRRELRGVSQILSREHDCVVGLRGSQAPRDAHGATVSRIIQLHSISLMAA